MKNSKLWLGLSAATQYNVGDSISTAGITVKAKFADNPKFF